jgi:hypothetical protein
MRAARRRDARAERRDADPCLWNTPRVPRPALLVPFAAALAAAVACHTDPFDLGQGARRDAADTLFASVTVSDGHACALTRGGFAFCWGYNGSGELGTDAVDDVRDIPDARCGLTEQACSMRPVAVTGGHRFIQLAVYSASTCGLRATGRVLCWGADPGGHGRNFTPVTVPGAPPIRSLGTSAPCGLDADGRAWCWAPGSVAARVRDSARARPVGGALRFRDIGNACGTTSAGALYCWNNRTVDTTVFDPGGVVNPRCVLSYNRFGPITAPCTPEPLRLSTPGAMTLRVADRMRSCGIDAAGGAVCWGSTLAALLGTHRASPDPYASGLRAAPVPFPVPIVSLFGYGWEDGVSPLLCARTADGSVYCRGRAGFGLYGNGTLIVAPSFEPVLVAGGMRFVSVDASMMRMCGVDAAGALYCWGSDAHGGLGSGGAARDPCYVIDPADGGVGEYFCALRPRRVASIAGR